MTADEHDAHPFGAAYWDERYRSGNPTSPHDPSPSLVAEVDALWPGRALDAGCGSGANATWLASHGWHVTAVDISPTALRSAAATAGSTAPDVAHHIDWVQADLTNWEPGDRRYDLVTSHYVHVPGPAEHLFNRLASWVAPGGTLLIVGHADAPATGSAAHTHRGTDSRGDAAGSRPGASRGHRHDHPSGARVRTEQVTAGLPADEWDIVVAEPRTHTVRRPDGTDVTLHDVVVRARRRGTSLASTPL